VPKDLELSGKEERFTVKVDYDTQALYGKVAAERTIVITSN